MDQGRNLLILRELEIWESNWKGKIVYPGIIPYINVLPISKDPGATLLDVSSEISNFLPDAGTIDGGSRALDGKVLEVSVLKPRRPQRVTS